MRVGLEQQFALNPVMKGKQMEEDEKKAGFGGRITGQDEGDSMETVGLVGRTKR